MNLNEIRRMAGIPLVAESYTEAKKPEAEGDDKHASLADGLKDLPSVKIGADQAAEYVTKLLDANISFAVVPGEQVAFYFSTQEDADAVKLEEPAKTDTESDEQPTDKE